MQVNTSLSLPKDISEKEVYWCSYVDSRGDIVEAMENNNIFCTTTGNQLINSGKLNPDSAGMKATPGVFGSALRNQAPNNQVDISGERVNISSDYIPMATEVSMDIPYPGQELLGLPEDLPPAAEGTVHIWASGPMVSTDDDPRRIGGGLFGDGRVDFEEHSPPQFLVLLDEAALPMTSLVPGGDNVYNYFLVVGIGGGDDAFPRCRNAGLQGSTELLVERILRRDSDTPTVVDKPEIEGDGLVQTGRNGYRSSVGGLPLWRWNVRVPPSDINGPQVERYDVRVYVVGQTIPGSPRSNTYYDGGDGLEVICSNVIRVNMIR